MGSLGAPGFGFGWAPAICFELEGGNWWEQAYVTPLPEVKRRDPEKGMTERDWERVKAAVLSMYGY